MVQIAATDWNEVTAIATAALALLTFLLVIAAVAAAIYAKRDIDTQLRTSADDLRATRDATQAAQAMAQRQLEASYRPLLIDADPTGQTNDELLGTYSNPRVHLEFPGGHADDVDPRLIYVYLGGPMILVAIPLRNVGNGLAVIDPSQITTHGQRLGDMAGCVVQRERVPPGETTRILCAPRHLHLKAASYPWRITVRIPYSDFIGTQASAVVVHLEQRFADGEWRLTGVQQVLVPALPPAVI